MLHWHSAFVVPSVVYRRHWIPPPPSLSRRVHPPSFAAPRYRPPACCSAANANDEPSLPSSSSSSSSSGGAFRPVGGGPGEDVEQSTDTGSDTDTAHGNGKDWAQAKRGLMQTLSDLTAVSSVSARSRSTATPVALQASNAVQLRLLGRDWVVSGRLLLILTPILWGGYTVSVKLLYMLPWALSPSIFNSVRLFIACLIVLPGLIRYLFRTRTRPAGVKRAAVLGGIEIGFWTFFVNVLQIQGLRFSTASRAAFLNQLSSVIVPFAAYAFRMESRIGIAVYLASVLSVAGVALFSLDDFSAPFTLLGEGVLLVSAFVGAAFVLRCKMHSAHPDASAVIGVKIFSQFLFSLVFAIPVAFKYFAATPLPFAAAFKTATPVLLAANAALVLYNGAIISWLSSVFHMKGQNAVPASEAVVIFASTPIWSALLAVPLGERFGLRAIAGAILIVCSTLLATYKKKDGKLPPSLSGTSSKTD